MKMEEKKEIQIEKVEWKKEALKGNFMPAVIMLEQNKINVDDIVEENNQETLLHLAGRFTFYNVIRVLLEKFHANINKKNKNGHTLLFLLVSTTNFNIINLSYLLQQKNLEIDIYDNYSMNPLDHAVITSFHYAFLFFVNEGLIEKHIDNYGNPLLYFSIVNNNKFAFIYLIYNKKNEINSKYFNNTKILSDVLICNIYNSLSKFIVKYLNKEVDLSSIKSCRYNIREFNNYNIYNYEILNTLYYYKKRDYSGFISALIKKSNIENEQNKGDFGYYYKYINLRFMLYNLILPSISSLHKILFFFIYFGQLFFICNEKNNKLNQYPKPNHYYYNFISIFYFFINLIFLFYFKKPTKFQSKNKNLESEISFKIKTKIEELPDIEEICPACAHIKNISTIHCYLCDGCIPFRIFHSNFFGCCISKSNIIYYLLYILSKMNFYLICLLNILKANPTNNGLICVFFPFWYKTSLKTFVLQNILGGLILINLGHLFSLLFCLSVKTPYKYIFEMDKRVYYKCLKENKISKTIVQVPEINDGKKIKNIFNFLFQNE